MFLHRLVLTAALAAPLAVGAPAALAAERSAAAIDGVDVEQVAELGSGVALRFAVYGTPQAAVSLRIEGGGHVLALRESEPGVYEGTYVIDARDAIVASSRVTATLQHRGRLASADLDEPLLLAAVPLPWAEAATVPPSLPATAGERNPVASPTPALPRPAPVPAATVAAPPAVAAPSATTPPLPTVVARSPQRVTCADCAYVQSVRTVEPVPGGPIGALAGAIAGAVLGRELGEAHHRRMLTLLGAIGGGVAGNEIGKQATAQRVQYDVVVRTADGRSQVLRFDRPPAFTPGDTVRLGAARADAATPAPF